MRSTRRLALAALATLPFAATAADAAPTAANAGAAVSRIDTRVPVVEVGRMGRGGFGMAAARVHGGGHGLRMTGAPHAAGFRAGHATGFAPLRLAGDRHGGHGHGGHGGHGHHGHHHHGHHHHHPGFYPGWYGVPYNDYYGPDYYEDTYYYDDGDDDAVVYSDDAVERCAARYRSFDRRSGTYLSSSGGRKICPYLR